MKIYAFDVDETLDISANPGPITFENLQDLKKEGHIIGICGNWILVTQIPGWHNVISFFNCGITLQQGPHTWKDGFLYWLKQYTPADEYIMVGNILGISGVSDDKGAADRAGWRFIKESNFAAGER